MYIYINVVNPSLFARPILFFRLIHRAGYHVFCEAAYVRHTVCEVRGGLFGEPSTLVQPRVFDGYFLIEDYFDYSYLFILSSVRVGARTSMSSNHPTMYGG